MSPSCDSYLSTGHAIGLAFSAQASLISFLSILIFGTVVMIKYRRNVVSPPNGPWRLLRTNIDAYMLNLLLADCILSCSGLIDLKWAVEKHTYCGAVCDVQGVVGVAGVASTAFFTAAIAIYTWLAVYRNQRTAYSLPVWLSISCAIWLFVILFTIVGWATHPKGRLHPRDVSPDDSSLGPFFVPTPFWCWISSDYLGARIGGEYLWIWLCGFGSIALYGPLFLFSRGNLHFKEVDDKVHWEWYFPARAPPNPDGLDPDARDDALEQLALRSQAWKLILYPIVHTIQILGLSIVRWVTFVARPHGISLTDDPTLNGFAVSQLFFRFVFRLSGLANVVLIVTTRPNILLFSSRGVLPINDPRALRAETGSPGLNTLDNISVQANASKFN